MTLRMACASCSADLLGCSLGLPQRWRPERRDPAPDACMASRARPRSVKDTLESLRLHIQPSLRTIMFIVLVFVDPSTSALSSLRRRRRKVSFVNLRAGDSGQPRFRKLVPYRSMTRACSLMVGSRVVGLCLQCWSW